MSSMLAIKVVGPGPDRVTRRFSISTTAKAAWEDVEKQIKALHSITGAFYVTYLDEDNEEIRIDSDAELADLIASAQRQNQSSIRFTVSLKEGLGNAPDPRESTNSVATYRTQASQNLSSIIPPPPSPKSFDREGWQVLDDGTPSSTSASNSTSASQSFGRNFHIHSGSSEERPTSQPYEFYRDSAADATTSFASVHSQTFSNAHPTNPFDDAAAFERVPPLFPVVSPTGPSATADASFDPKARADIESKLHAVIAENEARVEDMKKNAKIGEKERLSQTPPTPAGRVSSTLGSAYASLPEEVKKFIEQVRSAVASSPEALRQLNLIVDQQIARNVNVNLEYAIQQIQASIAKVHHTSVEAFNASASTASEATDKFSKAAREATYKARIEAYDASRRAYEEAKSAARMAKEAFRQARGTGGGATGSSSSLATASYAVPTTSFEKPKDSSPPSYLSTDGSGKPYAETAKSAAESGFGLGLPFPPFSPDAERGSNGVNNRAIYVKQLDKLRDMGFVDEGLNMDLLSQNDGEVERVVEVLMQLQV
ncbi:hypothetical protein HDU67_008122 [Dinochytrium kinnereticum]|nr:hypothetical protein HDU67_008122 [Dinochytrium kinnereticum]